MIRFSMNLPKIGLRPCARSQSSLSRYAQPLANRLRVGLRASAGWSRTGSWEQRFNKQKQLLRFMLLESKQLRFQPAGVRQAVGARLLFQITLRPPAALGQNYFAVRRIGKARLCGLLL